MRAVARPIILAALLLGGCASPDSLAGQRTVFSNPYAAPSIDRTGIGPQCEAQFGRDATCLGTVRAVSRRGRIAVLDNGATIRLTRNQARILREQAARSQVLRQQPPPPPPAQPPAPRPPVLPTADDAADLP
jgi:hypothetical protein